MAFAFGLYIRKKLTISKQQRSNKGIVFGSSCQSVPPHSNQSNSSSKSVHFSDSNSTIYYTYSNNDYDRGSYDIGDVDMGHQLKVVDNMGLHVVSQVNGDSITTTTSSVDGDDDDRTQQDMAFDDQCRRNTKVNKKRGYHSVAILVHYRSNF